MPYAPKMSVNEFQGSSNSSVLWTDKRLMDAFMKLRNTYGKPIKIGYAFKRIGEGGHTAMSQHYAGLALDMAQNLSSQERDKIRDLALSLGVFGYVEPKVLTPTWVHVDSRYGKPACTKGGYPQLSQGSRGVYVATLQDALNVLGHNAGTIDGIFGRGTKDAVIRFQSANNLVADGIVGCKTWDLLTTKVKNVGTQANLYEM